MSQPDPRGPDPGLRDLDWLLTPDLAASAFTKAGVRTDRAEPTYVRLKPGRGAIVAYELRGPDGNGGLVSVAAYARTFSDDHVRVVAGKWGGSRAVPTPLGPGFVLLEGGQIALFVFPNDAELRGVRKLDRVVSELEVLVTEEFRVARGATTLKRVRYKPERRFIAAARVTTRAGDEERPRGFFLRVFGDARGERLAGLAAAVRSEGGSSLVPRPLGTVLRGRVFVEEEVHGEQYLSAVLARRADPSALADALHRLHGCSPPDSRRLAPSSLLDTLSGALDAASGLDERVAKSARDLMEGLAALLPPPREVGLVHGDMALHNVLDAVNGPVIVDLERSALGDPLQDLGKVVAHLREEEHQHPEARSELREFEETLIEEYARRAGNGGLEALPFFIACALADRAAGSVLRRALDNWWPNRPAELLELALDVIANARVTRPTFFTGDSAVPPGTQWQVFYPKDGRHWAGFLQDPFGKVVYGIYDSATDSFQEVRPEDDGELPALRRWCRRGELLNYRVGRRATVRIEARDGQPGAYVKIRPPSRVKLLRRYRDVHELLSSTPGAPLVPPLIDYRPEEGVLVLGDVPGRALREFVLEGGARADSAIEAAARAVAQVHAIPGSRLDAPPLRPPMTPAEYAALAGKHNPDAAAAYRMAAEEVSRAVRNAKTTADRVVHGDLHDGNVLLEGDRPAILDLDLVHRGDPAEDVGNMMGHLFLRTLQRGETAQEGRRAGELFLESYRLAGGDVDSRSVSAWGALALFRLSCIYLFRRTWRPLTPRLLDEAARWTRDMPRPDDAAFRERGARGLITAEVSKPSGHAS
ncbi:MAG: aminoglycoside phosphotransferase family protein [Actinomycetota bacterium]|nr:aminoglycoside phosphotransferase family protein [Actinomycetota bacterium]